MKTSLSYFAEEKIQGTKSLFNSMYSSDLNFSILFGSIVEDALVPVTLGLYILFLVIY